MGDVLKHPGPPSDGGDGSILEQYRKDAAELRRKLDLCEAAIREEEGEGGGGTKLLLDFDDLFDAALALGQQYPTGFPTIDKFTDGGIARGTVTIIQGKPGIGKTLVATQIAKALAPRCAVLGVFADEGLAGARVRLGQQLGLDRKRMRRPDSLARDEAVRALRACAAFWKFGQHRLKHATLEVLVDAFERAAPPNLPRVWLLDSAQVLKAEGSAKQSDRRLRTSDLIWRVDELSETYGAIAILVSQVGRGAYRSKRAEDRVEDLAAGLETSAIEYVAELILHIDGNPKKEVKIRCPKNRFTGDQFEFSCRVDFPTATFHELDQAAVEQDEIEKKDKQVKDLEELILQAFAKHNGLTVRGLNEIVVGRKESINNARKALVAKGRLKFTAGIRGAMIFYRPDLPKDKVSE